MARRGDHDAGRGREPEVRPLRRRVPAGDAHLEHGDRHRHHAINEPFGVNGPLAHVPEGPVPSSQGGERLLDLVRVQRGCGRRADVRGTPSRRTRRSPGTFRGDTRVARGDRRRRLRCDPRGARRCAAPGDVPRAGRGGRGAVGCRRRRGRLGAGKLIHRHPHVFGEVDVRDADEVLVNWEKLKAEEKGEQAIEDDIPASLPALARAGKVQTPCRRMGVRVAIAAERARRDARGGRRARCSDRRGERSQRRGKIGDVCSRWSRWRVRSTLTPRARSDARSGCSPSATSGSSRSCESEARPGRDVRVGGIRSFVPGDA